MKCERKLIYTLTLSDDEMIWLLTALELAMVSHRVGDTRAAAMSVLMSEIKAAREL